MWVTAAAGLGVIDALTGMDGIEVRSMSVKRRNGHTRIEADLVADAGVSLQSALGKITRRDDVADIDLA